MFEIIALVCLNGQVANECVHQTAQSVVSLGLVEKEDMCMIQAQFRAGTNVALQKDSSADNTWIKFQCEKR